MTAGIIFGIVLALWGGFFLFKIFPAITSQTVADDDVVDGFADSMQIVSFAEPVDDAEFLADSGAAVSTPLLRRAERFRLRRANRIAVSRRRRGLLAHLLLVLGVAMATIFAPISAWWNLASVGLLVGWIMLSRYSVVTMRNYIRECLAELEFDEADEPTVILQLAAQEDEAFVETERRVEITGQLAETLGSLLDPIPVTPTTYLSRPQLPRSVRTIDLSAPVASSELRGPIPTERETEQQLPKAVGE